MREPLRGYQSGPPHLVSRTMELAGLWLPVPLWFHLKLLLCGPPFEACFKGIAQGNDPFATRQTSTKAQAWDWHNCLGVTLLPRIYHNLLGFGQDFGLGRLLPFRVNWNLPLVGGSSRPAATRLGLQPTLSPVLLTGWWQFDCRAHQWR